MKRTLLPCIALIGFNMSMVGGPIKNYAESKRQQLENLRKNPSQEIRKMMGALGAAVPYQQKPASTMIPDSIVNFFWDGSQYQQSGYDIIQYSAQAKVDFVKMYMFNMLMQTIDFQYPGGTLASSILVNTNPMSSNQANEKIEFTFNAQNKLVKTKIFIWENNSWKLINADSIHIINNTANPPKPQEIRYFVSEQGGPYTNFLTIKDITYDANTGLEKNLTFAIDLLQVGVPIDFFKYENTTWEFGHIDLLSIFMNYEEICNSIYPRYTLIKPFNYAYEFGPTTYQLSEINLSTQQLEPVSKLVPTYSGNTITSILEQEYDGSGWFTVGRRIPTFTSGKLTQLDFEILNGNNYTLSERWQFLYDSQGNYSGELNIFFASTTPDTTGEKIDRTYTGGKLTEEIVQFYSMGSGFQPSDKSLFFYKSNISVREVEGTHTSVSLYPNPAAERTFISMPFEAEWSISIADLSGRIVKSAKVSGQSGEISLIGLPAGTYVLTAHHADFTTNKKLVIRK